ncbi:DEAD/DEAH box helicase [Patulibacter defluvii]|uniref:DEAD/DEAH box helicase n=1 Tax=Patulibacter defluvii TaxID=3095358 RepID=UPI002A762454|nr:DEAD/DEAH box helicase [Patulibacter sp. DM4]
MALDAFTPRVRDWFVRAFDAPTAVQEQAWPLISAGEHVLISAPTGSGKTLAAFLWGLDRLAAAPLADGQRRVRLLYVSPLKALSHDVERNLRAPLKGIATAAGADAPDIRVGLRTGDTPQRERAAMRRHPPDVLITTPESLFLMLTSGAREILTGVETVIVDEIHAVAGTKRGTHLALTLERLAALREPGLPGAWAGDDVQRIGLSATQNPLEEVGRFLVGPQRRCRIVDTGERKRMDLRIQVPVESLTELDGVGAARPSAADDRDAAAPGSAAYEDAQAGVAIDDPLAVLPAGNEATRNSIWPAMYPEILDLVEQHRSTIVFVNSRRAAERLALRLNELAERRALDAEAAALAGDGDPNRDPDARWEPEQDGTRPAGELRRLAPDLDATLPSPERHARIHPRPVAPLHDAAPAGSHTAVVGTAGQPSARHPTGPHAVEIARAHHGSLSREERELVEELLKAGQLPCLVATSSLELGIDMGAVDLVLQIESPKSVAAGMQRIGRAGHGVGEVAKGRIFPKFRADLLECAVVARRMREGRIEPISVPRNPLDVLAQQIVAITASTDDGGGRSRAGAPRTVDPAARGQLALADADADGDEPAAVEDPGLGDGIAVDEVFALVTRTHSYAELPRELFERVLDMLDGRYPSQDFAELRPRIVWDRIGGTIRPRRGAGRLAIANAGTIPDRGLYRVTLPDGRRVGELDEEMVYEARAGQTFLLGASTWRIEEIQRDRVVVTPAPGVPGAVPFWRGDQRGRPKSLGQAIGAFSRWAVDQSEATLVADYDLDERAARNLLDFLREQQDATRVIPSDTALVVERFKDEIGDWRLCLLSPFGGRVHAAWGLAASRRIRDELGIEADAIWSDDGIIVHLPDSDEPPAAELLLLDPDEVEDLIVSELGSSALFGARFRENAGRALLIPRARPGRRTPLWQQRLKAQSLLEVAEKFPDFPVILETYRECLRDVLDVPGLVELLQQVQRREVSLVEVETATASPMASSLLFDYVATYMYEGDAPNAERRAAALSLDRDLLRELLGQDELRELLDEGALAQLEADLQHRSARTVARAPDALAEVLRRVGDLTLEEVAARVAAPDAVVPETGAPADDARRALAEDWLLALGHQRRAVRMRIGAEERWIAADDAGLYRDALGAVPPGGLPEAFLADVADPQRRLVVRYAATHGPFTDHELRDRYGLDLRAPLRELLREDELVRGEIRPGGTETEWCDPEVLRRLRRMSLAALRQEIEPADPRALVPFATGWQGIDRHRPSGAGVDRLREILVPLQGLALPVELWERDVLPRRLGAYSPAWLDGLCASGEVVWVGAGAVGSGSQPSRGRVALYFREDAAAIGPPMGRELPRASGPAGGPSAGRSARAPVESGPSGPLHDALRAQLDLRPAFFHELLTAGGWGVEVTPEGLRDALWDLIWAGEVTCDVFAPLRAGRAGMKVRPAAPAARRPTATRRRFGPRPGADARQATQGRFALTAPLFAPPGAGPVDPGERRRTLAELLLERHGIVTREHVRAEGISGGFSTLYDSFGALETLGVCRRGYFVEGLGGAQFALPGAVERLRAQQIEPPGPALAPSGEPLPVLVLDAADPAQPYGTLLSWPDDDHDDRPADAQRPRPQRAHGAKVVLVGPDPVLFVDRSAKGLQVLVGYGDERLPGALAAVAEAAAAGRIGPPRKGVQLERIDGLEVIGHPLERLLEPAGFRPAPTKYLAR